MNFLVGLLLFLLPFHAFGVTWAGAPSFAFWKELILFVILILSGLQLLKSQQKEQVKSLFNSKLLWILMIYLIFASASVLWAPSEARLARLIYGIKYELMPFIVLGIGLLAGSTQKIKLKSAIKMFYYGSSAAILFGLLIHFFIGPESLIWFGYGAEWSTYTPGKALAFCHKIENTDICRFQASFAGPNQAAFYILAFLPIAFQEAWLEKSRLRYLKWIMIALALLGFYLTYSRSAWLGLISMIGFGIGLKLKTLFNDKKISFRLLKKYILAGFVASLLLAGFLFWQMGDLFQQIVLRANSTSEHILKWIEGFQAFKQHPWIGQGLASCGPAARRMMDFPLIPESWFLQVLINTGLIGFSLFVSLYSLICWKLWTIQKNTALALLLVLLSLIVPMQVLHVFEDSSLSYSLFLLVGLYLGHSFSLFIKK